MVEYIWSCSCCGRQHRDLPTCWSFGPPDYYLTVPEEDVARRAELYDDVCRVDDHWFIRGHVEIPIIDASETLAFCVWASVSKQSMDIVMETWEEADRARHGPFFGWLNTEVAPYPDSLGLATEVRNRAPGTVPLIFIQAGDHPLSTAQRDGVTLARVAEIAEMLLPRH